MHDTCLSKLPYARITLLVYLLFSSYFAHAQKIPCLIEPDQTTDLGSPVVGVIESIAVERGDFVAKGDIIAILRNDVEKRTLTLAANRAANDTEVRSAMAALEHAQRERKRNESMFLKKLVTKQTVDKANTEASLATLQLEQARKNRELAHLEKGLADARLQQRTLTSPFSGLVADRYVSAGQRIQDQALVRIIKIDPLRVEVIVPHERFGDYKIGGTLKVTPEIANLPAQIATIRIIDKMLDPASNTFRMTLMLPNEEHTIPPGARCTIDLGT